MPTGASDDAGSKFQWRMPDLKPEPEELPKIEASCATACRRTSNAAAAEKKKEDGKGG